MDAFAQLFERFRQPLYALCLKQLNDHSLAEDIVQEVFIRSLISLPQFDRRKRVWPWMATIAIRMCIDLQRRRSFTHYSGNIEVAAEANGNVGALRETASALDAVIASERRAELFQSLGVLSKRQRRVFLLYALDGWTCAEIAQAEGISAHAVHHLLSRARSKMRAAQPNGPFALVILPFTWLRSRFQEVEERVRMLLGNYGATLSNACVQAVCVGTVAVMVVTAGRAVEPLEYVDATRPEVVFVTPAQARPQMALQGIAAAAKRPMDSQQSSVDPAGSLIDSVMEATSENPTPENTYLVSLAASPNYENDHTIFASSADSIFTSGARWLFVSRDGGASWEPLPSRLFLGGALALSPAYPQDRRIFALASSGLQQSDDGGTSFRIVSPIASPFVRSFALSPSFGVGDSRILIGDKILLEYDADTGRTQPALLGIPPASQWVFQSVAISSGNPSGATVFVADPGSSLYRCKGMVCETISPLWNLTLRLSPRFEQDGLAYGFSNNRMSFSNDGGRTFRQLQHRVGSISDMNVFWNTSSDPVIFVSGGWPPGIHRSHDGGNFWNTTRIDLPGFQYGADKLIVTPTGRLLATGRPFGIACSEDMGQTWRRRCTPEP